MRALISLTDKSNLKYLAENLINLGYELISTGGTLKAIRELGIEATDISQVTKFKEILDGRVKTLSPYVHGGILYRRGHKEDEKTIREENIEGIDIVVVNLYDFSGALKTKNHENIIENIDIGGPTLIRAAAKNHKDVLVVTDINDYEEVIDRLKNNNIDLKFRETLAAKAYSLTAYYDSKVARYFANRIDSQLDYLTIGLERKNELRYGENPTQKARVYKDDSVLSFLSNTEVIHGKEMSFNNYNDLNVAVELCAELGSNAAVALKHASPCGVSLKDNLLESYKETYKADPVSIFGGIVALNGRVDGPLAEELTKTFLEIIAANDFTEEALEILKKKKNLRLVKIDFSLSVPKIDLKYLDGIVLVQDRDKAEDEINLVTDKEPSDREISDLKFAMKVVKYVKSNAVVIVKDKTTLGIGGGETSRIWALENIKNHYDKSFKGGVLASDAFFPFDDCVSLAGEMGISSIIQPGGSLRDKDSIDKCNELGISMIFSKNRHFKH